jgi:hypothetical protein
VRSLTLLLVERGMLGRLRYLEHGAFYAIGGLAIAMFARTLIDLPDALPGCASAAILGLAAWASARRNRRDGRGRG